MKKIYAICFFSLFTIALLNSCWNINHERHLTGRYFILNNKFGKSISVSADDSGDYIELVKDDFDSVGFDGNYIVLKYSLNNFEIVPVYSKYQYFPEKGIISSLSLNDFIKQKKRLKIHAEFTIGTK